MRTSCLAFLLAVALLGCPKKTDATADLADAAAAAAVVTAVVDAGNQAAVDPKSLVPHPIRVVTRVDGGAKDAGAMAGDAGKAKAGAAAASVPHCQNDEGLYAVDEHAKIFCAKSDSCSSDKDCGGKGTCTDAMIMQDDGTPALSHNGAPMGGKICKPK